MTRKASDIPSINSANAAVLAELVVEPTTPEALRIKILNKLLEASEGTSFFKTIYEESLSLAECPECGHSNHWLVPEDDLNKMSWVSHEKDSRVLTQTNKDTCPSWEEACSKRRISV